MITGREIIDTLEKVFELEWYRYKTLDDPNQHIYPPIIVWRFKDKDSSIRENFEISLNKAVKCFQGNVEWVFTSTHRNFALIPSLIVEMTNSGKFRTDTEIVSYLAENNPEYGKMANCDVPNLAKHIEQFF
jgi:hypothetical protein